MTNEFIDLTDAVFGEWIVIRRAANNKNGSAMWLCRCSCGKERVVYGGSLRSGRSKSCGHYYRARGNMKHGGRWTKLYMVWDSMRSRCFTVSNKDYESYGGRGITVCNEWNDFSAFREWALTNGYKEGLSIDRIDNDGNYEPSNCRWATAHEQRINQRPRKRRIKQ